MRNELTTHYRGDIIEGEVLLPYRGGLASNFKTRVNVRTAQKVAEAMTAIERETTKRERARHIHAMELTDMQAVHEANLDKFKKRHAMEMEMLEQEFTALKALRK